MRSGLDTPTIYAPRFALLVSVQATVLAELLSSNYSFFALFLKGKALDLILFFFGRAKRDRDGFVGFFFAVVPGRDFCCYFSIFIFFDGRWG